ncbi:hypothetical protein [Bauldia sp.]|uniref:hypothetical protein n=1 Tax=Bauldia sp. TaxID=2575872 RepID=UPI003BAAD0DA
MSALAVVVLAVAFVGHLHGYAFAKTEKLVHTVTFAAETVAAGTEVCDRTTAEVESGCASPRGDVLSHGVGGSCSFFAMAVLASVVDPAPRATSVWWARSSERLTTAPVARILRPPISVI